jgi:hypothetical protein
VRGRVRAATRLGEGLRRGHEPTRPGPRPHPHGRRVGSARRAASGRPSARPGERASVPCEPGAAGAARTAGAAAGCCAEYSARSCQEYRPEV